MLIPTRCHGNHCSSPKKGGGLVCDAPAGGSPLMMTSLSRCSAYLLPLSDSQTGEMKGSPGDKGSLD